MVVFIHFALYHRPARWRPLAPYLLPLAGEAGHWILDDDDDLWRFQTDAPLPAPHYHGTSSLASFSSYLFRSPYITLIIIILFLTSFLPSFPSFIIHFGFGFIPSFWYLFIFYKRQTGWTGLYLHAALFACFPRFAHIFAFSFYYFQLDEIELEIN